MESFGRKGLEKRKTEDIRFPAADAAARTYEKAFAGEEGLSEQVTAVKEIFREFFEEQALRSELFRSSKRDAAFLHSAIDSAVLAKKLYERAAGSLPPLAAREGGARHQEYIFSSFFSPKNPSALYVFFEQGVNQLVRELPAAFEAIGQGKEPEPHIVHYLGSPTRDLGHVSPGFVRSLEQESAFDVYGELYAELVERDVAKGDEVVFRGISLGAPQALAAAKALVEAGALSQDRDADAPHLAIRIDTPPAENQTQSLPASVQVPAGFALDGIKALLSDPMSRASANPFTGSVVEDLKPLLAKQGISEEMSDADIALKKQAIQAVFDDFYKGYPVPEGLKVTEVLGTKDTTMLAPLSGARREMAKAVAEQKEAHGGSLGGAMVSTERDRRTFAADMGHAIPNITPTVLRRLRRAAQALAALRTGAR
jgi:hypothetical protein